MPLPTLPTTGEVRDRIVADIEAAIGQSTPLLYKAFNRVIAAATALVFTILYKFGQWAYKQIFTITMDDESLELKGAQYGIERTPASASIIEANVTGEITTEIPQGKTFRSSTNGLVYAATATTITVASPEAIELECLTAGEAGNLVVSNTLTILEPIPGLDITATVTAVTTEGADRMTLETYRALISEREKRPPQGGSLNDYIIWSLEVPGITRAFAWGNRNESSITAGDIEVYPLNDGESDRIPSAAKLTEVEDYIDDPTRAPLQVTNITAVAFTEVEFTVDVTALSPDSADIRTEIEDNITAFLAEREPQQFVDQVDVKDTISRSWLESVCIQSGVESCSIDLYTTYPGTPVESYTLSYDELAKLSSSGIIFP